MTTKVSEVKYSEDKCCTILTTLSNKLNEMRYVDAAWIQA